MLATSLGRAGAAAPPDAGTPIGPAGPVHPDLRLHDNHPPWSRTQPRTAATPPVRQPRAAACSVPTAQPPATCAPHAGLACLVGQRASVATTALTQAGRVRRRHPTDQRATSVASPAVIQASAADRAARRRGSHRDLDPFPWCRLPRRTHLVPNATACGGRRRTRPDGRGGYQRAGRWTGGHHTAGRWMGGHQTAGPPDPGRRTQVTGHRTGWTPDGLHTRRLDSRTRTTEPDGWTPHAGRGPATDAMAGVLALPTTARTSDRWLPVGGSAG
jgi:hypothetical protein